MPTMPPEPPSDTPAKNPLREKLLGYFEGSWFWGGTSVIIAAVQDSFLAGAFVFAWAMFTVGAIRTGFITGRKRAVWLGNGGIAAFVAVLLIMVWHFIPHKVAEYGFRDVGAELQKLIRVIEANKQSTPVPAIKQSSHENDDPYFNMADEVVIDRLCATMSAMSSSAQDWMASESDILFGRAKGINIETFRKEKANDLRGLVRQAIALRNHALNNPAMLKHSKFWRQNDGLFRKLQSGKYGARDLTEASLAIGQLKTGFAQVLRLEDKCQ